MKSRFTRIIAILLIYAIALNGSVVAFAEYVQDQYEEGSGSYNDFEQPGQDTAEDEVEDELQETGEQEESDSGSEDPEEAPEGEVPETGEQEESGSDLEDSEDEPEGEPQGAGEQEEGGSDSEDPKEDPEEEIQEEVQEEIEEQEEEVEDLWATYLEAYLDGVQISLHAAEGVLPYGTSLAVNRMSSDNYKELIEEATNSVLNNLLVYDIDLFDEEGKKVQPNGEVEVSFANLPFQGDMDVFHLESRTSPIARGFSFFALPMASPQMNVDLLKSKEESNSGLSFKTDHFSIYAVGEHKLVSYEFYIDGVEVTTQIVKNGDTLYEPEVPTKQPKKKFVGWYTDQTTPLAFGEVVDVDENSPDTIRVNAKYDDVVYVYFVYRNNIVETKEVIPGDTTDDQGINLVVAEPGWAFSHWSKERQDIDDDDFGDVKDEFDFSTPIDDNLFLYANMILGSKVSFNSRGGSQELPMYVPTGEAIESLPTPERTGFIFKGWFTGEDADGTQYNVGDYIQEEHLDDQKNLDLYAKWQGKTVKYNIVYWQENANDDDYTYKETVEIDGTAGDFAAVPSNLRANNRYPHFETPTYAEDIVIKGDGSTVVNVRYKRKVYKVEFNLNRDNSKVEIDDKTVNHPDRYSFEAKFESDISHLWPTADNIPSVDVTTSGLFPKTTTYYFRGWTSSGTSSVNVSKRMDLTSDLISTSGTKVFTGSWITSPTTYRLRYMIETLNGSTGDGSDGELRQYPTTGSDRKWYQEDLDYSQTVQSSSNSSWSAKAIKGVSIVNSSAHSVSDGFRYFYYTRNSYNLDFHNPNKISSTGYLYGLDISDKYFVPERPSNLDKTYTFAGWYTTPEGYDDSEFNFTNAKMPEYNVALYAKWVPPTHIVKFYEQPGGNLLEITNIPHGDFISDSQLNDKRITPTGLVEADFNGWYWHVGPAFVRFDFDFPIERDDIIIYPVWDSSGYNVKYLPGAGTGDSKTDGEEYHLGAAASILGPEGFTGPLDDDGHEMIFLGWKRHGSNEIYYPNDKLTINGHMTLTAQWGVDESKKFISLVYKANNETSEERTTIDLRNNATVQLLGGDTFSYNDYIFDHWNTVGDASGYGYEAGEKVVVVDNIEKDDNILYAIWLKINLTKEGEYQDFNSDGKVNAGDKINYTFKVTNDSIGIISLDHIDLTDFNPNLDGGIVLESGDTNNNDLLDKDETWIYTGSYTLTQADIDAGKVVNTAEVYGKGLIHTTTAKASDTVPLTQSPEISIEKTADSQGVTEVGDEITYTIVVSNTGNLTLTGVEVKDPMVDLDTTIATMAPGATESYTKIHIVTQADLDAGEIVNTATAKGKDPQGNPVEKSDTETVDLEDLQEPAIDISKAAVVNEDGTISYTITVENTGNLTITSPLVTDSKLGLNTTLGDMIPGAKVTLNKDDYPSFEYTPSLEELDAGQVVNTARVDGEAANGETVSDEVELPTDISYLQSPDIGISKASVVNEDGTISYTITVENTGNLTITSLDVEDSKVGLDTTLVNMAPGAKVIFNKDDYPSLEYSPSLAELDAGQVVNTATAEGTAANGGPVSDEAELTTDISDLQNPDIDISKTAVVNEDGTISYTITVKNTGNITLTIVNVVDPKVNLNTSLTNLEPDAEVPFTVNYTPSLADLDAGEIENTATANGTAANGGNVTSSVTIKTDITGLRAGEITVEKTSSVNVGEGKINYTIVVENTGNVTLTDIEVKDPKVGLDTTIATLAPGGNETYTVDYEPNLEDLDAGQVVNTATAVGEDPAGNPVTGQDSDTADIDSLRSPELVVEKRASLGAEVSAGDKITYTITVTNTGNVTLTDIEVKDTLVDLDETIDSLAPGEDQEYTREYVIEQADLDAGEVLNEATVLGKDPNGDDVTDEDEVITSLPDNPGIKVEKTGLYVDANDNDILDFGDRIDYTFIVTNTGNVTLSQIVLNDGDINFTTNISSLAPGDTVTLTASYALTQADINAGEVKNKVEVVGKDPSGADITGDDEITTPLDQDPELKVEKSASLEDNHKAGDQITYTITVTNTGNVTLTNVHVVDELVGLDDTIATMNPGDEKVYTETYAIKQVDLNKGFVVNTVTALGKDPKGEDVPDKKEIKTDLTQVPELTLEKTADLGDAYKAGDKFNYIIKVSNTGNVLLTNIVVEDNRIAFTDNSITSLEPNQSVFLTAEYTLTQVDIDTGEIVNKVEAIGKDTNDGDVFGEDELTTELVYEPDMKVEKTGVYVDVNDNGMADVGDRIDYTITVTNTGNITLTAIKVVDSMIDLDETIASLAPGATETFTGSYEFTQDDLDAGKVVNKVKLKVEEIDDPDEPEEETPLTQKPGLTVDKAADLGDAKFEGDKITYTITVTNSGNVTLTDIKVKDDLVDLDETIDKLAPGEFETFTKTYTLTQADIDAGEVDNKATALGKDPNDEDVAGEKEITTELVYEPDMKVEKTGVYVDVNDNGMADVGDRIDYTITVSNTGNVTLTAIKVVDSMIDLDETIASLAPGATETFTGSYAFTQDDLDAGLVINKVELEVEEIDDPDEPEEETPLDQVPELTVEKTADIGNARDAGDTINYTIVVTNSGNVTLTDIKVKDNLVDLDETIAELAPGGFRVYTKTYTLTHADIDAGEVDNKATALGKDPKGEDVTGEKEITTELVYEPELTVFKAAAIGDASKAGDSIEYTVRVR